MKRFIPLFSLFLGVAIVAMAQRSMGGRGGPRGFGGGFSGREGGVMKPRQLPSGSTGTPMWENPRAFEKDVWTFARIQYSSDYGRYGYYGRGGGRWTTDTPDSDLNFSYRLQQMTSMKVDPDGRFLTLTDPDLA